MNLLSEKKLVELAQFQKKKNSPIGGEDERVIEAVKFAADNKLVHPILLGSRKEN